MLESAQEIFDYLPVRQSETEARYIRHLWLTFEHLAASKEADVRAFAVAPFHLLFMFSLQYRGMRIHRRRGVEYAGCSAVTALRGGKAQARNPVSVVDMALVSESKLADIFSILDVPIATVESIKKLVRERNEGFAHAKGAIESNLERKIEECLAVLRNISPSFVGMNTEVANEWLADLAPEDDRDNYVETRVASEYLCPIDFRAGLLHDEFAQVLGIESFE